MVIPCHCHLTITGAKNREGARLTFTELNYKKEF